MESCNVGQQCHWDEHQCIQHVLDNPQAQSELPQKAAGAITLDAKTISPTNQSGHSGSRPGSTPGSVGRSPQKDYYWFAHAADTSSSELKPTAGSGDNLDQDGRESVTSLSQKDREERIRLLRERQSEERQRKLEDLKLAALHAQKVREQQEDERRRKIEELRHRDQERRLLVEERKKQIWEAERERREAILRKNMEREARIEAKRNANRSSIGFAFGSSTPRLLETDPGYFSTRRATSQTNVMLTPTTPGGRSSAEREIDPSKKRASSSFGLDHKENGEDLMTKSLSSLMGPPMRGRRKTDLIPTIPSHDSPRTHSPVTRTTPSSPSRPNSSMSQQSISSHASQSSTVSMRSRTAPRRPRPFSIAGTAPEVQVDAEERQGRSTERKAAMPSSAKPPRAKSAGADRAAGDLTPKQPPAAGRKVTPASAPARPSTAASSAVSRDKPKIAPKPSMKSTPKATPQPSPAVEQPPAILAAAEKPAPPKIKAPEKPENVIESPMVPPPVINQPTAENIPSPEQPVPPPVAVVQEDNANQDAVVGTPPKPRINTVEEAKAAIAERRRLAREQAEREAELERQRQEELRRQEEERLRQEEEERKRWEEEQEMARKAEEERIQRAIEEQNQRELEEQKRKEEEARLRAEKEEAERKAREEQEQMRRETEERLRKEEEERAERRKRVEAIMSRTRGKGTGTTPVTTPTKPVEPIEAKESNEKSGFPNAETKDLSRDTSSPVPSSEAAPDVRGEVVVKPLSAPTPKPDLLGDLIPQTLEIHTVQNGGKDLYENVSVKPMELVSSLTQSLVLESDTEKQPHHTNGFAQNGLDKSMDVDIIVENSSPEKMNSSLEDFGAEHQRSSVAPPLPPQTEFEQLIDLGLSTSTKTEDFLTNEDNVNSNITTNGPGAPFIAFEDNFTKKQESNVTDLLS